MTSYKKKKHVNQSYHRKHIQVLITCEIVMWIHEYVCKFTFCIKCEVWKHQFHVWLHVVTWLLIRSQHWMRKWKESLFTGVWPFFQVCTLIVLWRSDEGSVPGAFTQSDQLIFCGSGPCSSSFSFSSSCLSPFSTDMYHNMEHFPRQAARWVHGAL